MADLIEIGMLATIENGEPRFRPMTFHVIEDQLWTIASPHHLQPLLACDGQHVEIVLLEGRYEGEYVRGILSCSSDPADYQRFMWEAQADFSPDAFSSQSVVIKVIPE